MVKGTWSTLFVPLHLDLPHICTSGMEMVWQSVWLVWPKHQWTSWH